MNFYAINRIGTNQFLPAPQSTQRATTQEATSERPPRLFRTRQHAQCALTHWLRDITFHGQWNENDPTKEICPMPHRKPEHYEILCVNLHIV